MGSDEPSLVLWTVRNSLPFIMTAVYFKATATEDRAIEISFQLVCTNGKG